MHRRGWRPLLACALLLIATGARAQQLPLWELGGGGSVLRFPDYRGSEESRTYVLPVPWLVYRGELLRADRDGMRATLFDSERVEFNISINGSVPVRSDRNRAREGMEDLRALLEVGPVANVRLWRSAGHGVGLDLRVPARVALAFRGGLRDIGYITTPHLNLDVRWPTETPGLNWNLGLVAGVFLADRRYNQYFYGVSAADATATRPEYRASSGYGGWQAIAALSRRLDRFWFGGFIKYDDVSSAVFEDSPLVTQRRHLSAGVAVTYIFAQSSRLVTPRD